MKLFFLMLISVYSLFGCGYSIYSFVIDPKSDNIQMLLKQESIHIKQVITNNESGKNRIFEEYNFKFGEEFKQTKYDSAFFAVIDKDLNCYDLNDSKYSIEIKKSGDGIWEPAENMIKLHSYCFSTKVELDSFLEKNKSDLQKEKRALILKDFINVSSSLLEFFFLFLVACLFVLLLYFPFWLIFYFVKKSKKNLN